MTSFCIHNFLAVYYSRGMKHLLRHFCTCKTKPKTSNPKSSSIFVYSLLHMNHFVRVLRISKISIFNYSFTICIYYLYTFGFPLDCGFENMYFSVFSFLFIFFFVDNRVPFKVYVINVCTMLCFFNMKNQYTLYEYFYLSTFLWVL